jgi:hypothetical protein
MRSLLLGTGWVTLCLVLITLAIRATQRARASQHAADEERATFHRRLDVLRHIGFLAVNRRIRVPSETAAEAEARTRETLKRHALPAQPEPPRLVKR